ncbi:MAG: hypothetical protein ACI4MP_11010, partial [Candidatus Ventricola sp.]
RAFFSFFVVHFCAWSLLCKSFRAVPFSGTELHDLRNFVGDTSGEACRFCFAFYRVPPFARRSALPDICQMETNRLQALHAVC